MRISGNVLRYLLLLALSIMIGTAWHEVVGHGLTAVLCGGNVTYVETLGLRLWPTLGWVGWQCHYGYCETDIVAGGYAEHLVSLAGSVSTWGVAVVSMALLWMRPWRGWPLRVLVVLSLWWADLLTYTLPSWGLRRSILWGRVYSEPYSAAVGLGVPGPVFQAAVVGTSLILVLALAVRLARLSRRLPRTAREVQGGAPP